MINKYALFSAIVAFSIIAVPCVVFTVLVSFADLFLKDCVELGRARHSSIVYVKLNATYLDPNNALSYDVRDIHVIEGHDSWLIRFMPAQSSGNMQHSSALTSPVVSVSKTNCNVYFVSRGW